MNTNNGDTDYGHYGQPFITDKEWAGEKKGQEGKQHYPLRLGAEDSHILSIALVKGPTG
jgi:hypothetical protein